jgi:hypothetical protein
LPQLRKKDAANTVLEHSGSRERNAPVRFNTHNSGLHLPCVAGMTTSQHNLPGELPGMIAFPSIWRYDHVRRKLIASALLIPFDELPERMSEHTAEQMIFVVKVLVDQPYINAAMERDAADCGDAVVGYNEELQGLLKNQLRSPHGIEPFELP